MVGASAITAINAMRMAGESAQPAPVWISLFLIAANLILIGVLVYIVVDDWRDSRKRK